MNSTHTGSAGGYRRTKSPNGAGPSAEQMDRIAQAGQESQRRRQAEQDARRQAELAEAAPALGAAESVRQQGDPVTGEPPRSWVRGVCPECGQPLVAGCYRVGGRGFLVIHECWGSLQTPATCRYRKVL